MPQELAVIERQLTPLMPHFAEALRGSGLAPEKLLRTILVSLEKTPSLQNCSVPSIIQAAMTAAVLGLEADGALGQFYMIPFAGKAQPVIGYRGYATLAGRSGFTINGAVVREGDQFDFELGSTAYVHHKPELGAGRGRRILGAWATASRPGHSSIVRVMDIDELMFVKGRSPGAKKSDSPWNDAEIGFPAMCEKTPRRRLARDMPVNLMVNAAVMEEAHEERGKHSYIDPMRGVVIEGMASPAPDERAGAPTATDLDHRKFVIDTGTKQIELGTIEEWRGRMMHNIEDGRPESVARMRDASADLLSQYRGEFPDHVRAVEEAFAHKLPPGDPVQRPGSAGSPPPPADPIPERAEADEPKGKRGETADGEPVDDPPGTFSETNARQYVPAEDERPRTAPDLLTNPVSHGEAGGSPAPAAPAREAELPLAPTPASAPRAVAPPQRPHRSDWYDRESLRLEPTRHAGRANWSAWYAAQFLPRLKTAQNTADLARLLGRNADLIQQYQREAGANEGVLANTAIERQWQHVAAWEAAE